MGRYDKIRYWNGSSWVQPNEVKYWNGSNWVSLGTNNSYETKSMQVWNGSAWVRKTLNRTDHWVPQDHYLQYSGGAGVSISPGYQWYQAVYACTFTPDNSNSMMIFECYVSSKTYVRFGIFNDGGKFYAYSKSSYNGNVTEVNTKDKYHLTQGQQFYITTNCLGATYLQVDNHSTGYSNSWQSSTRQRFYYNSNPATLAFNSPSVDGRAFYGKIKYLHVEGCYMSTTSSYAQYNLNDSPGGSSVIVLSGQSSAGGVTGVNLSHSGTIVDPSYGYTTWD